MSGEASILVVPGRTDPAAAPTGLGVPALWALLPVVLIAGAWAGLNGRRRRRTDPRELAFRRLVHARGWSRSQVRVLRRAAAGLGLDSPVGLALSQSLTATVLAGSKRGHASSA